MGMDNDFKKLAYEGNNIVKSKSEVVRDKNELSNLVNAVVSSIQKIILSEKEKALLELIATSEDIVTVDLIRNKLSKAHVGAIGRLLGDGLVESKKTEHPDNNPISPVRMVKYYIIKRSIK